MKRAVIGFERDDEGHWVAKLQCGRGVHVRHDPLWTVREWAVTEQGRAKRVGTLMECKKCEETESGS
jgi:Protein of unknown function (DUF3565)